VERPFSAFAQVLTARQRSYAGQYAWHAHLGDFAAFWLYVTLICSFLHYIFLRSILKHWSMMKLQTTTDLCTLPQTTADHYANRRTPPQLTADHHRPLRKPPQTPAALIYMNFISPQRTAKQSNTVKYTKYAFAYCRPLIADMLLMGGAIRQHCASCHVTAISYVYSTRKMS